jgi:hypothetical protein
MLASVACRSGSRRIVAIQLDQLEGVEEGIVVSAVMLNETPRGCRRGPSIFHDCQRKLATASTISGKRRVESLPGRLESRSRRPSFGAIKWTPSCLIS